MKKNILFTILHSLLLYASHAQIIKSTNINKSLQTNNSSIQQRVNVVVDEGIYKIKINQTGKYIAIEGVNKNNGAKLVQWDNAENDNHKFMISKSNDGYYLIKAMHSNRYLNVEGQSTQTGAAIIQYDYVNQDNLKWILSREAEGIVIRNKQTGNQISLSGALNNTANGATIILNSNEAAGKQTFTFERVDTKSVKNGSGTNNGNLKLAPNWSNRELNKLLDVKPIELNVNGVRYKMSNQNNSKYRGKAINGMVYTPSKKPETDEGTEVLPNGSIKTCKVSYQRLTLETMDMDVVSTETMDNIKPGIVYDLKDVQRLGIYKEYTAQKNPMTLRINAPNIANPVVKVNNPSDIEEMGNAVNGLLNRVATGPPLGIEESKFTQIRSENEFRLAIGIGGGSPFVNVNTLFNMNKTSKTEKFLFQYRWIGYTLEAIPAKEGIFADAEQNQNAAAVYVDKIAYGSRILVSFELDENTDLFNNQTSIDASYGPFSANANFLYSNSNKLRDVKFKIISWGVGRGFSGNIINANGIEDLKNKLSQMISSLKNVPNVPSAWGKPITYSLRFLDGTTAVASSGLDELPQRFCTISDSVQKKRVTLKIISLTPIGDCDAYGQIWAQCFDGNDNLIAASNNLNMLFDVSKKAHLGEKGAVDVNGLFGKKVTFLLNSKTNKLDGAYIKIWSWINDDDASGDDVMQLRGGVREVWRPNFSPWAQKVYIPFDIKPSDAKNFTQSYAEDGDECVLEYMISVE
ncbi:RICIN domain-containing protein [Ferruginibacter yonginensis]|uniref:RICIN domain-containing protein n=1 Tax=Ferruginibacter yonginensis TaxID=1310416 RepID=A0ABV8QP26_9BACT